MGGFKLTILVLIFVNAIFLALESAYDIQNSFDAYDAASRGDTAHPSIPVWIEQADLVFFGIFCLELVLRLLAHEGRFLFGTEWRWNLFDFTVVSLAAAEIFLADVASPTLVRLLRILKISRSFRTFRLLRFAPSLYPLRLLLLSCKNSLAALFWSSVLLLLFIGVFGIIFVSGAKTYVDDASSSDLVVEDIREHFETLPTAMLSLFLSFLGEAEFKNIIEVLGAISFWYCALYFVFILFTTLAIMNVIASIFVSDALELASHDRELTERGEMMRARKNMDVLSTLFQKMDVAGCGMLSMADFRQQLQEPEVQVLLSHFKFDIVDSDSFFTLLDVDGNGTVDIEEFVVGCLRMHGKSNAIDMEISIQETKQIAKRLVHDMEQLQKNGVKVKEVVHDAVQLLENLEASLVKGLEGINGTAALENSDEDVFLKSEGATDVSAQAEVCFSAETQSDLDLESRDEAAVTEKCSVESPPLRI